MDPAQERIAARMREGFALWNEGALERADELWHDEMIWVEAPLFPDSGTHHGLEACVARMRERISLLGKVEIEVIDVELGEGNVLVEAIVRGEGTASGVPVEGLEFFVWEFAEDRRVIRWREFLDRDEARAALE